MADRGADGQTLSESPQAGPLRVGRAGAVRSLGRSVARRVAGYFRENEPTFWAALLPAGLLAAVLFVRSPLSNYIFDEQEALLANPYVNGKGLRVLDAFRRDFWGLPPERSIGSYRPIPNLIWRALWPLSQAPWLHHWVNVVLHAANAALVCSLVWRFTRDRRLAWLSGCIFVMSAILTEAVSGVVGIADVLCGLGVLLAILALELRLWLMPLGVFAAVAFGLFSKESAIVALPLVAWVALASAPLLHARPLRGARALLALLAAIGALVFYTYLRRHYFPVALTEELRTPIAPDKPAIERGLLEFLRWFQQPRLPQDPINNPLSEADFPHRVAGALRVYLSGLGQILVPWRLSGDYSYRQEPIPERWLSTTSVVGALALILPLIVAVGLWLRALWVERAEKRRPAAEFGLAPGAPATRTGGLVLLAVVLFWIPVAYFPHSNIPILLPTVRAERFWYLPVIGASIGLALSFNRLLAAASGSVRTLTRVVLVGFLTFQGLRARQHALDYTDDLSFWKATRSAAPNSAKAHLNYSVMLGARGHLNERLAISKTALELAPRWPMAHIYYADTLCRLKRPDQAWPHYVRGFKLAPNDPNLIALGLQCLWDEKAVDKRRPELLELADSQRGSWLAYLATDLVNNGAKHGGIEKKYRPRGYDEGPKSQ